MKKLGMIMMTIITLVATLVVSSFAWFQLKNNGVLSADITTRKEIAIYFSEDGTNGEFMTPAKLKKGVINDPTGSINGSSKEVDSLLVDENVLPLFDEETFTYVINNNKLVARNEYFEAPATIVYSQFEVQMSTSDATSNLPTETLSLEFNVKYFNVDANDETIGSAVEFEQMEALQFNFFLLEQGLSLDQLSSISTHVGEPDKNKMIEKYVIDNDILLRNNFGTINHLNATYEDVKDYRVPAEIQTIEGKNKYTVSFAGLEVNRVYYVLIESYYRVPDELVRGNLPLTGKFVLDMKYSSTIEQ